MKLNEILEAEIKTSGLPLSQSVGKDNNMYKSELYFLAAQAFKQLKKRGMDPKVADRIRSELCDDERCSNAFEVMVSKGRHYLTDEERAEVGL